MRRAIATFLAICVCAAPAWAGVPLKGITVSLGKVPGGGCAQKTTDANGHVDFGAWPVLPKGGVYTVTVANAPTDVNVTITGARGGQIVHAITHAKPNERMAPRPIRLISDGKTPLVVQVEAAQRGDRQVTSDLLKRSTH